MLQHPAQGLQVSLSITALIEHLKVIGSDKSTKTLDFCGKFLGVSAPKATENTKQQHMVSEATFVDEAGGTVAVAVWDKANLMFESLENNVGVLVIGCNGAHQDGDVKLSSWAGTHISTSGEQAQSLTRLDADQMSTQTLTAKFSPGKILLCAAALAYATGFPEPVTWQINRCFIEVPLQAELVVTQKGAVWPLG